MYIRNWGDASDRLLKWAWKQRPFTESPQDFDIRHGDTHDWPTETVAAARRRLGLDAVKVVNNGRVEWIDAMPPGWTKARPKCHAPKAEDGRADVARLIEAVFGKKPA